MPCPFKTYFVCAALSVATVGCAATPAVSKVRFENKPPVTRVYDRRNVPEKPDERHDAVLLRPLDYAIYRRLTQLMDLPTPRRAMNTNSLGEVPDSTWFVNRIGVRDISPEELRRGPRGKKPVLPFYIKGIKEGGKATGFTAKDATGQKYIIKFDSNTLPATQSASDVVSLLLFWAIGYNVPENWVMYVDRSDLKIAKGATLENAYGAERLITDEDVDNSLKNTAYTPGEPMRLLASKFLPGIPIGGWAPEGIRDDDVNDTIPHEHRREVRAMYVFNSWLQHTDFKDFATLDMWVEDPDKPGSHFVQHFLVDFGNTLGAFAVAKLQDGHTETFDPRYFLSIFTLGLWKRPWEDNADAKPGYVAVGRFSVKTFEPDHFRIDYMYPAWYFTDDYDGFWAAKIIMKFRPEHLRAALSQGVYPDKRAHAFIEKVLIGRQRKLARYWFGRVNPLDQFTVEKSGDDAKVCFEDLLLKHELAPELAGKTTHNARSFDYDGNELTKQALSVKSGGARTCISVPIASSKSDYTIALIDTSRGADPMKPVEVHFARATDGGKLTVIGIHRQ